MWLSFNMVDDNREDGGMNELLSLVFDLNK